MTASEIENLVAVRFKIGDQITLEGELRIIMAPRTINRILSLLPITSRIHKWQEEIYFEIGAKMGSEKAVTHCQTGDITYWPQGDAICLFFNDMVPYSQVNPIGKFTTKDPMQIFQNIQSGMIVHMTRK